MDVIAMMCNTAENDNDVSAATKRLPSCNSASAKKPASAKKAASSKKAASKSSSSSKNESAGGGGKKEGASSEKIEMWEIFHNGSLYFVDVDNNIYTPDVSAPYYVGNMLINGTVVLFDE